MKLSAFRGKTVLLNLWATWCGPCIKELPTLDALAPLMKQGAELRLATDDPSYLPWMVEHACTHPAFEWLAERPADWRTRPADWPGTRYETKRIAGTPTFLRLRRR